MIPSPNPIPLPVLCMLCNIRKYGLVDKTGNTRKGMNEDVKKKDQV